MFSGYKKNYFKIAKYVKISLKKQQSNSAPETINEKSEQLTQIWNEIWNVKGPLSNMSLKQADGDRI